MRMSRQTWLLSTSRAADGPGLSCILCTAEIVEVSPFPSQPPIRTSILVFRTGSNYTSMSCKHSYKSTFLVMLSALFLELLTEAGHWVTWHIMLYDSFAAGTCILLNNFVVNKTWEGVLEMMHFHVHQLMCLVANHFTLRVTASLKYPRQVMYTYKPWEDSMS